MQRRPSTKGGAATGQTLLAATALLGLVATSGAASGPAALAADPISITPEDFNDLVSYEIITKAPVGASSR